MPLLKCTDTEIVYGRKSGERLAAGITGLVMLAISTGIPILLWSTRAKYSGQAPLVQMGPVGFGLMAELLGLGILLVFLVNEEIILDLTARTYRYRSGLPLLSRWHTGPLSDIEDVVLLPVSTKQGTAYRVAMKWKSPEKGFWRAAFRDVREAVLGIYAPMPQAAAESEMKTVVQHLALPGVTGRQATTRSDEEVRQRGLRLTILITLVATLLFAILFGPSLLLGMQFAAQGRTVRGTITEVKGSRNGYTLAFTYAVNGQLLQGEDTTTRSAGEAISPGEALDVTYLPSYPKTCRTHNSNDFIAASVRALVIIATPLMLVSLFYLYRFRPRSHSTAQQ